MKRAEKIEEILGETEKRNNIEGVVVYKYFSLEKSKEREGELRKELGFWVSLKKNIEKLNAINTEIVLKAENKTSVYVQSDEDKNLLISINPYYSYRDRDGLLPKVISAIKVEINEEKNKTEVLELQTEKWRELSLTERLFYIIEHYTRLCDEQRERSNYLEEEVEEGDDCNE